MITITAPAPISGVQHYGPNQIEFHNGVAVVEELPSSVADYMRGAGYIVDVEPRTDIPIPTEPAQAEVPAPDTDTAPVEAEPNRRRGIFKK